MKTFYSVTLLCFILGMLIVSFHAPWTSTPAGSPDVHNLLGYAPVWSSQFSGVPGSRMDTGGVALLAGVVAFFSVVLGGSAYFFRGKRTGEKDLME